MYQLEEAYNFLNKVLQKHAHEVLRLPAEEEEEEPAAPIMAPVTTTVERIVNEVANPQIMFPNVRLSSETTKPPVAFAPVRLKRAAKVTPVA
jgi:hypothetical protein